MTLWQLIGKGECPQNRGALCVRYNTNVYEDYDEAEGKLPKFKAQLVEDGHILGNEHLKVEIVPLTVVHKQYRSIDDE